MFKIENTQRILNDIEETKSQQVTIRKKNERFLSIISIILKGIKAFLEYILSTDLIKTIR